MTDVAEMVRESRRAEAGGQGKTAIVARTGGSFDGRWGRSGRLRREASQQGQHHGTGRGADHCNAYATQIAMHVAVSSLVGRSADGPCRPPTGKIVEPQTEPAIRNQSMS